MHSIPSVQRPLKRFEEIDNRINADAEHGNSCLLEEYVDLGLSLAAMAEQSHLQEHWLSRLYRTMLKGAQHPKLSTTKQEQYREFVSPLFCVLKQFYQTQPNGEAQLVYLDQSRESVL